MKILFLDIDGVLNCSTTKADTGWPLDPYMVLLLHRIIEATGCHIVLSSSWRHSEEGVDTVKKALAPHELFGTTPKYSSSSKYGIEESQLVRGHNIQDWLDEHPEVEKYAIVDDFADMLEAQLHNFFRTSFTSGLTEETAEAITSHLK